MLTEARRAASRAILVTFFVSFSGCAAPEEQEELPPPRVHCVPAGARTIPETIDIRGAVVAAPDHSTTVSAEVAGRLVRVAVREGQDVSAGDLIAEVETQPARDSYREAQAFYAEALANRDSALTETQHVEALVEDGIEARRNLETHRAALARAEAALASARARAHAAQRSLSRTTVTAPLAGAVVHLVRREGELVDGTSTTPICDVVDMSALELSAPVTPAQLLRLHPGQHARVRFDGLDDLELGATVRTIGRAVGANGMGHVWLTLELGDVTPPLGVLGSASVAVSEPREVVTVPSAAVRDGDGERVEVVVCDSGVTEVHEVEVGRREDGWVEVKSGLSSGDEVAVDEVVGLEDGVSIDAVAPEGS